VAYFELSHRIPAFGIPSFRPHVEVPEPAAFGRIMSSLAPQTVRCTARRSIIYLSHVGKLPLFTPSRWEVREQTPCRHRCPSLSSARDKSTENLLVLFRALDGSSFQIQRQCRRPVIPPPEEYASRRSSMAASKFDM
jgi:hypothetical protein